MIRVYIFTYYLYIFHAIFIQDLIYLYSLVARNIVLNLSHHHFYNVLSKINGTTFIKFTIIRLS